MYSRKKARKENTALMARYIKEDVVMRASGLWAYYIRWWNIARNKRDIFGAAESGATGCDEVRLLFRPPRSVQGVGVFIGYLQIGSEEAGELRRSLNCLQNRHDVLASFVRTYVDGGKWAASSGGGGGFG